MSESPQPNQRKTYRELSRYFPTWGISLAVHCVILLIAALCLSSIPVVKGVSSERTAEVGIELKSRSDGKTYYRSSEDFASESAEPESSSQSVNETSLSAVLQASDLSEDMDVSKDLPQALGLDMADITGTPGGSVSDVLQGGGSGSGTGLGEALDGFGKGTARCFGTTGTGRKFVYVFDRSGSMGGGSRSALAVAKAEMLLSIQSLTSQQQFQIIFYNETPTIFSGDGLALADDRNRELARRFMNTIFADGGTDHLAALKKALQCKPDVVFFLTDADEPRMSNGQLETVHRLAKNSGVQINTIEFGLGLKSSSSPNFIEKLADQNSGQYIYIDITSR